jgi:hypothetical protein
MPDPGEAAAAGDAAAMAGVVGSPICPHRLDRARLGVLRGGQDVTAGNLGLQSSRHVRRITK